MHYFFLILIFCCANALSFEQNETIKQESFFDKTPSEQRSIFIDKINIDIQFIVWLCILFLLLTEQFQIEVLSNHKMICM